MKSTEKKKERQEKIHEILALMKKETACNAKEWKRIFYVKDIRKKCKQAKDDWLNEKYAETETDGKLHNKVVWIDGITGTKCGG